MINDNYFHPKQVALWDTGGLERFNSMTSSYFHLCHAMILVYDSNPSESASITALREWIENCHRYNSVDSLVLSLWANQTTDHDEDGTGSMLSAEVRGLIDTYNIPPSLHFKVSGLTGKGIMNAFNSVVETVTASAPLTTEVDNEYSFMVSTDSHSLSVSGNARQQHGNRCC